MGYLFRYIFLFVIICFILILSFLLYALEKNFFDIRNFGENKSLDIYKLLFKDNYIGDKNDILFTNNSIGTYFTKSLIGEKGNNIDIIYINRYFGTFKKNINGNFDYDFLNNYGIKILQIDNFSEYDKGKGIFVIKINCILDNDINLEKQNLIDKFEKKLKNYEKIEELTGNINNEFINGIENKKVQIDIDNKIIKSSLNNLITFSGENLGLIDKIIIGDESFNIYEDNLIYFIKIEKNLFKDGKYFIFLKLKNGDTISIDKYFEFISEKDSFIFNMSQGEIRDKNIVFFYGTKFNEIDKIFINTGNIYNALDFEIINDNMLFIKLDNKKFQDGIYELKIFRNNQIYNIMKINYKKNDG